MKNFFNKLFSNDEIELQENHLTERYNDKSELPKNIRLEFSTICQLNCPVCYMRKFPKDVKKGCGLGYLKFENFKKLVDENEIHSIEISNNGEAFLNPDFIKIVKYANEKNIELTANNGVNMNYLTDEQAEAMVKYNFKGLTVSIDGASNETYSIYRVGGNYGNVIENIKKINFYKEKYNACFPYLVWKFIVFGHNEHEIDKAKEEASRLGMIMRFDVNWDKDYSPIRNKQLVLEKTGLFNLDVNISPVEQLYEYEQGIVDWYFCRDLWEPQINWDGKILGCCANYKEDFDGNAFTDGLFNALNNPKLIYAKNMVTNNAKANKSLPCYKCWVYKDMKKHDKWLKSPKSEGKL